MFSVTLALKVKIFSRFGAESDFGKQVQITFLVFGTRAD